MCEYCFAKTKTDKSPWERVKQEFGWVKTRLLEEFPYANIYAEYFDFDNSLGIAVAVDKNGKRRRNALKLIDSSGRRFDQTTNHEEYLEKFIEKLKT